MTLTNHGVDTVSILASHESLPCPVCQQVPGNFRSVTVFLTARKATFEAFINGTNRGTITCHYDDVEAVSVDWSDNHLKCVAWTQVGS